MDAFDQTWTVAAENGQCDALGSVEYERVRKEWDERGARFAAFLFIATHCNNPAVLVAAGAEKKAGAP